VFKKSGIILIKPPYYSSVGYIGTTTTNSEICSPKIIKRYLLRLSTLEV